MGDLFGPIITFAVAIILFEGSLNLDFKEIKGFSKPIARIVTIGAFIAWIAGSASGTLFGRTFLGGCLCDWWPVHCHGPHCYFAALEAGEAETASSSNFEMGIDCC